MPFADLSIDADFIFETLPVHVLGEVADQLHSVSGAAGLIKAYLEFSARSLELDSNGLPLMLFLVPQGDDLPNHRKGGLGGELEPVGYRFVDVGGRARASNEGTFGIECEVDQLTVCLGAG